MRGRASEQTPIGFAGRGGPDFARHDRAKGVAGFGRITAVAPAKAGAAVVLRSGAGISLQRPPPSRGRRVVQYPLTTPKRPLEPFVSNDAFNARATFVRSSRGWCAALPKSAGQIGRTHV